jgi:hypothetical protein
MWKIFMQGRVTYWAPVEMLLHQVNEHKQKSNKPLLHNLHFQWKTVLCVKGYLAQVENGDTTPLPIKFPMGFPSGSPICALRRFQ